ncbi:unnamed protein product [Plasmodium vivax]|uniref:(malaria parasite P. vivax) hypothetical protein n=1 Tax=Plasmodium vivax TaxID=5855 RepID=A0A8S4H8C3_PLAVI|nr:unnamed protein product [Plasmodium vivax]
MPEITVDTDELKRKYPFLDKIWNLYEEFNKAIDNSDNHKSDYDDLCKSIMGQVKNSEKRYNDICIKLIRNLGTFDSEMNTAKYNSERCKNLNSWLYYIIKNYNVQQDAITKIFEESNNIMKEGVNKPYCLNYSYKDIYNNPDDVIKLINLEEYMNDLLSILKDNNDNNHCLCRNFIFECANIYRDMNKKHCADPTIKGSTKSYTCYKLQEFSTFFTSYICREVELKGKLPSLDAVENEHILTCPSDIEKQKLEPGQKQELDSNGDDQSSSPKKISISTAIGTMAGIPPFLALIYKFTPVGRWFRSKKKKGRDVFKNLDEEIEKELYYPRHENAILNSSHARYNVAYEQI